MTNRPQVLVVTGMSGAGRSTAAFALEDLGYTVVDNLPPQLIGGVIDHYGLQESRGRLVVALDARSGDTTGLRDAIDNLERSGVPMLVLFLDADDQTIFRRYEENRRPHPLRRGGLAESIGLERELLAPLREMADVVIDTTDLNVHQLRNRITGEFAEGQPERPMRVALTSFGFKHGTPRDADLMLDVRFLPNPHWVPELRPLPGTDEKVADYVLNHSDAIGFLDRTEGLLDFLIPRYQAEGKSYLSIAVGCTGGRHRSVALAAALAAWLEKRGITVSVSHRDLER